MMKMLILYLALSIVLLPKAAFTQGSIDCEALPDITRALTPECKEAEGEVLESSFGSTSSHSQNEDESLVLEAFSAAVCEVASSCETADNYGVIPSIDITIQFEINSDRIRASERWNVRNLAEALSHPALKDKRFLVIGHTDVTGQYSFNMDLSKRRAVSVRWALVELGVNGNWIEAIGMGPKQLLPGKRGDDPSQRRVSIYALE